MHTTVIALSTTGVQDFIKSNVLNLVLLVIGVILIARSQKKDHKGAMSVMLIVGLGLFVVGLSIANKGGSIGSFLAGLIG